jgi:hypothetical protein
MPIDNNTFLTLVRLVQTMPYDVRLNPQLAAVTPIHADMHLWAMQNAPWLLFEN